MRRPEAYARRGPFREPYASVLIVCEGGKTEPFYFSALRSAYRLSSANIKITPANGSDPISVVAYAESELEGGEYDKAYCVFDRDGHANYNQALSRITQSSHGRNGRLIAANSVPCFEIWILLHFVYSTAPFTAVGNQSACERVIREVQKHLPVYAKGYRKTFDEIAVKLTQAITHAGRLTKHNRQSNSTNPGTNVHQLVDFLLKLKV